MEWYRYFSAFLAGGFLANAVPHFVQGISGNRFPTPFSRPHGKGLSSPTLNVICALLNLLAGYSFCRFAGLPSRNILSFLLFFAGVVGISIYLSKRMAKKDKE